MDTFRLLAISIIAFTWISCTSTNKENIPTLSVTNNPQKYFLEQIVGDKYKVNCIIPPGANPESIDLTPSQIISLSNSVAYFKIGFLEVENILVKKVQSSNSDIKIIECSAHIDIIKEETPHDQAHDHSNCDHHGHADGDPHTWSSPETAKTIAKNMYDAMVVMDKENTEYYKSNFDKLIAKITATDSIIKSYLDTSDARTFIIFHPALSYFSREYNLEQLAIEYEGKNPSPSQLKGLIDRAKEQSVHVVFIQQEFDAKNAETIAKSIGAKMISIDLLAYDWNEEMIKIAKAIAIGDE